MLLPVIPVSGGCPLRATPGGECHRAADALRGAGIWDFSPKHEVGVAGFWSRCACLWLGDGLA